MDKAEKKQTVIELRELCRKPVDKNDYDETFNKVVDGMKKADFRDTRYMDNLKKFAYKFQGGVTENIDKGMKDFTFDECRTLFTYLIRGEHWQDGVFPTHINNKRFFKILERAVDVMP